MLNQVANLWIIFGIFAVINLVIGTYVFALFKIDKTVNFFQHVATVLHVTGILGFIILCITAIILGPIALIVSIIAVKEAAKDFMDEFNKD